MIDWTKPETFELSQAGYQRYREDNTRLHNSVARENPEQDLLSAIVENRSSFEKIQIDGKGISEYIGSL